LVQSWPLRVDALKARGVKLALVTNGAADTAPRSNVLN